MDDLFGSDDKDDGAVEAGRSVSCEGISGKPREEKNAVIDQSMKEEKKEEAAE